MFKWLVLLLMSVHGVLHFIGVVHAFELAQVSPLTSTIARPMGVLWGVAAVTFIAGAVALLAGQSWWWLAAGVAVVLSQIAIVGAWGDAKYGTIANVALLVAVVIGCGSWRFADRVRGEEHALLESIPESTTERIVHEADVAALPEPVARWLRRAGVVGRPRAQTLRLTQRGEMQTARGGAWMAFRARQLFVVPRPAFLWVVDVDGPLGLGLAGRDLYVDGRGQMRIELLSLIPVVDAAGPKIDQGTLVRFLAETIWFPSAALQPYIEWEPLDQAAARATMRWGGVEASGLFRFDDDGDPVRFEASRYRDESLADWIIDNDPAHFALLDGVRVPTRSTVTWRDDDEEAWTWLKIEVESVVRDSRQNTQE